MYKIIIKGEAKTDFKDLRKLDGIVCQDDFVEYLDKPLSLKLDNGYLRFEYTGGKLYSVVEYEAFEKLSEQELQELKSYTSGQLSDGIGEGFEQEPCYYSDDNEEVFISPWFYRQLLEITQEEI